MRRYVIALLLLIAIPAVVRSAEFDSTAALARARELCAAVSAGDAARVWPALSARMRTAMKDSASFARMTSGIATQVGTIDSVRSEQVQREGDGWTVLAECRYSKAPVPLMLTMSFDPDGSVSGLSVRPASAMKEAPSDFLDYSTKTALRLPFDGEWTVIWGGRTIAQNYHAANATQRFAMDLVMRKDGRSHAGDGKRVEDYWCWNQPILAPGAGTLVAVVDSLPDQVPGEMDRAHPAGNHVLIDHGNGEYTLLAHLRRGSVEVKPGEIVRAGQPVGRCGNSGNTSEPHLHMHLQNSPKPLQGQGLPAFFGPLVVDGKAVERAELLTGQVIAPAK